MCVYTMYYILHFLSFSHPDSACNNPGLKGGGDDSRSDDDDFSGTFFSKAKIYIKGDQLIFIPHIGISRISLQFYCFFK